MASFSSQAFSRGKELVREGDGEEDDGEELLDPRVKGELDRLNSSTVEINRLEQDLEELQAAFRQTLTESAYVLNSQAAFLGKCVSHARPYYDAMRKAKQSQIETQKAALKYERTCTSHQAAKKMLAIAEQKLVSTSKEHKVLDPTWQEMLNQAILKVIESDKERALSEKEHLDTARAFSEAGNKVTELRTKLKSAISKSRPYFDLKMKYDQILEGHKRQVEITQEGLQEAKKKYSLALKNLEGISEEIHEMRRSRDSLDTILHEREEGVGAESPCCDLSHDTLIPQTVDCVGSILNKPTYGFKIALVSASKNVQEASNVMVGLPVGERDGDPEGCNFFDEQQLDVVSKNEKLFEGKDSESRDGVMENQTRAVEIENRTEAGLNSVCQSETHVVPAGSCDEGEVMKVPEGKADEMCHTDKHLARDDDLCRATDYGSGSAHEAAMDQTLAEGAPLTNAQEQKSIPGSEDLSYANQHLIESKVLSSTDEASKSVYHTCGTVTRESLSGNASVSDSEELYEKVSERDSSQESNSGDQVTQPDHIGQSVSEESLTDNAASVTNSQEEKSQIESEKERNLTNRDLLVREESSSTDAGSEPGHIGETVTQESVKESALVTHSRVSRNDTGAEDEIDNKPDSAAGEELRMEMDIDGHPDFQDETANQQLMTENVSEQEIKTEAENENAMDRIVADREELLSVAENDSTSDRIDEIGIPKRLPPESESFTNSQEQGISGDESNENATSDLIGQG